MANLPLSIAAMLTQLAALSGSVLIMVTQTWRLLPLAVGIYLIATVVRLLQYRRRGVLELYADGVAVTELRRTRRFRWNEISFAYGVLRTKTGERIRLIPVGRTKLEPFEGFLRQHGVEAAREK